ncbi:hypothetical protein [Gluconacetobacter asukensis]|uniref:Uncharacterized protein n=1 Tax=Gluconacetobacter asukensis TaxID=1017181 RepID=A0A7W4P0W6_9PROT|nr:hypothetical protein [Gluconacetobacter asukensis]MBB2173367.1 hypothetical protein [Gluconacetobacter asukensis]
MTDSSPPPLTKAEKAEIARQERLAREAAALRANLRRRKQQSRARADTAADETPAPAAGTTNSGS